MHRPVTGGRGVVEMPQTRQTRVSTGGKAPRKQLTCDFMAARVAAVNAAAANAPKEVQEPCIFWEILGIAAYEGGFVRWPVKKDEDGRILRIRVGPYIDVCQSAQDGEAPRVLSRDIWDGFCADLRIRTMGDPQKWTMKAPWQPYREWLVTLLLCGVKAAASEDSQVKQVRACQTVLPERSWSDLSLLR
eukprot:m.334308 g.334308  ORF g.334308 m.334308 type:complete len:189 (-) comp16527_c0_seq6:749-1315(-)